MNNKMPHANKAVFDEVANEVRQLVDASSYNWINPSLWSALRNKK